jgi:hypothetical protein
MKARARKAMPRGADVERSRAELLERLEARRPEVEQAVLARVYGISDPGEISDPAYFSGLQAAVVVAIEFGFAAIGSPVGHRRQRAPVALLAQARLAARNGVRLDVVLRRYAAGYALLGDYLVDEAKHLGLDPAVLKQIQREQAGYLDHLLGAVGEEYAREQIDRPLTSNQRRAELVEGLLAGELIDSSELAYPLDGWNLGVVASGSHAGEVLRRLLGPLDRSLLVIERGERVAWGWLGGRRKPNLAEIGDAISNNLDQQSGFTLALGEPGEGIGGWRLSHHQAAATLPIALRRSRPFTRYADVALQASIFSDDLLSTSLRQLYLDPLEREREGGRTAKETLRAYFAANRNATSAAASLGVSRRTVTSRLRSIEEDLGVPLDGVALELEVALRLEALEMGDQASTA